MTITTTKTTMRTQQVCASPTFTLVVVSDENIEVDDSGPTKLVTFFPHAYENKASTSIL